MELKILHLYPDCMSLYGEYANVAVLRRHLENLGVSAAVSTPLFEDTPDFGGADFIYMGAGTERTQKAALTALRPHAEALRAAVEGGAVLLFTGGAMEILGASITDAAGKVWPGLGLAGFTTQETDRRTPHDVIAVPTLWEPAAVGFMNKCSRTAGVETPLFSAVTMGFGNEARGGPEGYVSGNVFATHITGPVLVKNPAFAALLTSRLFERKGWPLPPGAGIEPLEEQVYQETYAALAGLPKSL
ncbi:MAG: hypothetical protein HFF60_05525 [Oscillospiraceae bacterium]|jgi:CobQ-like glutamine amidotransferase family enzyme|nr:hypothetical protein [Oscillospiraceae bacterium]MCI9587410.1 hypothetical protein [Oscillospiraceae bacterium]